MTNKVTPCLLDLEAKVLLADEKLAGKVFRVYSEADLLNKSKMLTLPAIGIIYEGTRNVADFQVSKTPSKSCELVASIVMICNPDTLVGTTKYAAAELLDAIREQIRPTRSPTGHFWTFVVEAPAAEKDNRVMWIQRWSTPVQI